jgi:hypothetical protein
MYLQFQYIQRRMWQRVTLLEIKMVVFSLFIHYYAFEVFSSTYMYLFFQSVSQTFHFSLSLICVFHSFQDWPLTARQSVKVLILRLNLLCQRVHQHWWNLQLVSWLSRIGPLNLLAQGDHGSKDKNY